MTKFTVSKRSGFLDQQSSLVSEGSEIICVSTDMGNVDDVLGYDVMWTRGII
jgi:hypothetical protein